MVIATTHLVEQDRLIEIRCSGRQAISAADELDRINLGLLETSRLFRFRGDEGALTVHDISVLCDPSVESATIGDPCEFQDECVDVFCRPGVTDTEGDMADRALAYAGFPFVHCKSGTRHRFSRPVPADLRVSVERAIGNPLIHEFDWHDGSRLPLEGVQISRVAEGAVYTDLRDWSDEKLLHLSRMSHLALDRTEMQAVAGHFRHLGRPPTDVELQSIALTWSEHCSHKTFKATIAFNCDGIEETIPGLLRSYLAEPTARLGRSWVRSAFIDNAGVIEFDRTTDLAFKVETHNHPSALEPYGGAHTGVGGVIRDILAVSADPIANTNVLCFGPPELPHTEVPPGVFSPGATLRGVVRGVADYGNNMGIPTVGGAVLFHPGYTTNPLVYCGTVGLAPRGGHPSRPRPDDLVILLGGQTGRDGIHGATMSSTTLDRETVAGSAVQIGAPMTEKGLRDVLPLLRDRRLYSAITDCGAGGLCSAIGEMGAELGVEIDLALVPLKYAGLRPWEIWLSEAQERLVLAVPRSDVQSLLDVCATRGVDATVLGSFRDDGQLRILYNGDLVVDLTMRFLHDGRPPRVLQAHWTTPTLIKVADDVIQDPSHTLLALLAHPTIASKENVIRRYDHEVGAATVGKSLVGRAGHSDAAVLRPRRSTWRGVVIAHGINPLYGSLDPHAMAMLAVDEALRNLVAAGGSIDRAALLDNFCWGDVDDPDELGALVRAAQGCRDAAITFGVPFISGKDSLRNTSIDETGAHSIPRTLLVSAMGVIPDIRRTTTTDLKQPGNDLYVLGTTHDELGGSHTLLVAGREGGAVPRIREQETPEVMRRLTRAIRRGLVASCHDLSEGGIAVAAAEMAIGGGIGLTIDVREMPTDRLKLGADRLLFSESSGRFLIEAPPERADALRELFRGLPISRVGTTTLEPRFLVRDAEYSIIDLTLTEIESAWRAHVSPLAHPATTTPEAVPEMALTSVDTSRNDSGRSKVKSFGRGEPKALVLAASGINCDQETVAACHLAGAQPELIHLNQLLSGERSLHDFAMIVLPGGFSYGDHLGAGAMLATVLRYHLFDDLTRLVEEGKPLLGICNGFQVLARLGLLGPVSLIPNNNGLFECRWVSLQVQESSCIFLRGLEKLELPIANGQGRVWITAAGAGGDHSVSPDPVVPLQYVDNPNGSMRDAAGVSNARGNVFGMMPHPERYLDASHHPLWQRRIPLPPLGVTLFRNAVEYARREL